MTTVLIHPIGLDRSCWWLCDIDGALAIDLPGHGERHTTHVPATLEAIADDVAAQLRAQGVAGPVHVAGLSLGGSVALHLAVRHPELVRSLVVACSSPAGNQPVAEDRAEAAERGGMSSVTDVTLDRWFTSEALDEPEHPGVEYARRRLLADDPRLFAATWRALGHHDATSQLPDVDVPVTVLAGSVDQATPMSNQEAMCAALPNARLVIAEGPHMLQLECPDSLSAAVADHHAWAASSRLER